MIHIDKPLTILLLGSGGRECAFAWKMAQSPNLDKLYIAPGNAGTSNFGKNVEINPNDFEAIGTFVLENSVDMVVVGPEEPLVRGVRDFFKSSSTLSKIPVLGPSAKGAQLEGSKSFSKAFMEKYGVPTAKYLEVTECNIEQGKKFLETLTPPYVLKADGLAAGKGVLIIDEIGVAQKELEQMIVAKRFGEASAKVVIEEYLNGIECSVFVATDGKSYKILPEAKDYKRIGEGDTGLNTGGMGAVSPVPFADERFMAKVTERIVEPTVRGLELEELDYCGFIFIGLMNCGGDPYVIEYNVRMGDPETEVVLPRISSDIVELFVGIVEGCIDDVELDILPNVALTVVCTAGGYPEDYGKGDEVSGTEGVSTGTIFHAGTAIKNSKVVTTGGRVLAVTSIANEIEQARTISYTIIDGIHYDGMYYRRDIGLDLL